MELADDPLPETAIGPRLAAGRDTTIYALGDDRVLRRAPDRRSYEAEAAVMEHVRAAGYPVPGVHRVAPGEMVLDRIDGPTMVDDLGRRPWRMDAHARLLADLHHRLHRLGAPAGLRAGPAEGDALLHLDLHPQNVILSPSGPVVIDWTNAAQGAAAADVALTWIILACSSADERFPLSALIRAFRRRFCSQFLAAAGRDEARRALAAAAESRAGDRNIRPAEAAAMARLVAAEAR